MFGLIRERPSRLYLLLRFYSGRPEEKKKKPETIEHPGNRGRRWKKWGVRFTEGKEGGQDPRGLGVLEEGGE